MILYSMLSIFLFSCCYSAMRLDDKGNSKLFLMLFSVIIYAWFWSTRSIYMGTDTLNYFYSFLSAHDIFSFKENPNTYEVGFNLFISSIKTITKDYQYFLFISILTMSIPLLLFFKKMTTLYPILLITVLMSKPYIGFVLNIQRQGLAFGFYCLSVYFLVSKKYFMYAFLSVLSFLFHSSTLPVIAITLGLYIFRANRKISFIMVILSIAGLYFIFNDLDLLTTMDGNRSITRLQSNVEDVTGEVQLGTGYLTSLIVLFFGFFSFYYYKSKQCQFSVKDSVIVDINLTFFLFIMMFCYLGLFVFHDNGVLSRFFAYSIVFEILIGLLLIRSLGNTRIIMYFIMILSTIKMLLGSSFLSGGIGWA